MPRHILFADDIKIVYSLKLYSLLLTMTSIVQDLSSLAEYCGQYREYREGYGRHKTIKATILI